LWRHLDCAVIDRIDSMREGGRSWPIATVKRIFTEGLPIYPKAVFLQISQVQASVCKLEQGRTALEINTASIPSST
jgi:hypothetical protein